jgi:hypothetical protein
MNEDIKNLEEAYTQIFSEMAYRPGMPRLSVRPKDVESGEYLKKAKSSYIEKLPAEEKEAKIKEFFGQIQKGLDILEKDHNNIDVARSVLNIVNNFPKTYDDFEINGKKMSYTDLINELLKLTTTPSNDPDRIKIYFNPETKQEISGQTIDQYLKTPNSDRKHYHLFRELLAALPEQEIEKETRSSHPWCSKRKKHKRKKTCRHSKGRKKIS